jgi:hypothetical protein
MSFNERRRGDDRDSERDAGHVPVSPGVRRTNDNLGSPCASSPRVFHSKLHSCGLWRGRHLSHQGSGEDGNHGHIAASFDAPFVSRVTSTEIRESFQERGRDFPLRVIPRMNGNELAEVIKVVFAEDAFFSDGLGEPVAERGAPFHSRRALPFLRQPSTPRKKSACLRACPMKRRRSMSKGAVLLLIATPCCNAKNGEGGE